jgi:hypothetical protein
MKIYCIKNKKITLTPLQGAKYYVMPFIKDSGTFEDYYKYSSEDKVNNRIIYRYDKTIAL